jgi:hypothetical protein
MTKKIELPEDLVAFLRAGKKLKYDHRKCEAGQITLIQHGRHKLGEVWIDAGSQDGDPKAGKEGYYAIPAVNLVAEAEGYDPEFILLWLPESKVYGSWDCDHWELRVFPDTTWSDIARNPLKYVNAQWEPDEVESELLVPWPKYPFKKGQPF